MSLEIPFCYAATKIAFDAKRSLVAFFVLTSSFMMMLETALGTLLIRSAGGRRSPCNVAVHPFHGIGGAKRHLTGKHLVECDARSPRESTERFIRSVCSGCRQVCRRWSRAVDFADSRRDRDTKTQEAPRFHRRAEQATKWFAARIFEHEHGSGLDRARVQARPRGLEVVFQPKFVNEAIEEGGNRTLSCWQDH